MTKIQSKITGKISIILSIFASFLFLSLFLVSNKTVEAYGYYVTSYGLCPTWIDNQCNSEVLSNGIEDPYVCNRYIGTNEYSNCMNAFIADFCSSFIWGYNNNYTCNGSCGQYCSVYWNGTVVPNPPAQDGVCSYYPLTCSVGEMSYNSYDPAVNGDNNHYVWWCSGMYGGSGTECYADPAIAGECSTTEFQCTKGSPVNVVNNFCNRSWACSGINGGETTSCPSFSRARASGACGSSINSCDNTNAVMTDQTDTSSANLWNCSGTCGGPSTDCSIAKVDGVCDNSTVYGCSSGGAYNTNDAGAYNYWWCSGSNNGASSPQCIKYKPVNGACNNSTPFGCNSGSPTNASGDTNYNYWQCSGSYGGSNSETCSYPKTNGECGINAYQCNSGTSVNNRVSGSVYAWDCNGSNGGTTASCSRPVPVDASCGSSINTCNPYGVGMNDTADDSNYNNWQCIGKYGGASVNCSIQKINASCVNSTINGCSAGSTFSDIADDGNYNYWQCLGVNNGSNSGTCSYAKVNGSCGGSVNACNSGSLNDTADDSVNYNWQCVGSANGTTANCPYPKPPVVSVSMSTSHGGSSGAAYYGESGTLSWTASNSPTGCSIYQNGGLLTTVSGGTTSYGVPGLSEGNTTYRVDCSNAGGTGTGNTVTFKVPTAPTNMSVSCPSPGTTANFSWTLPSGISNTYFRYYKQPPAGNDYNAACASGVTPPNGSCINVAGSSVSQATDYNTNYWWYIHSKDAYDNWSNSYGGGFYCTPPAPAAPSISGPTLVSVGVSYNYSFSATDPAGMQVKYQIDWDNNGNVESTTSLGNSGWTYSEKNSWGGAGSKTFAARTVASDGRTSGWATYTVTVRDIPVVSISSASSVIDYNTQGAITWSSSYATGGCNVTKAGNAWQSGTSGSSVATGVLTTDTTFDIYCSNGVDTTHTATTIYLRPTVSLTASPTSIAYNDVSTIVWSSSYASSCSVKKAGSAWMTGTSNAGALSGALLSSTAFNLLCTATNGNTNAKAIMVTVLPLNGTCSGTLNTCTSGKYEDVTDTTAAQLWNCTGANGGTTENCSILNPPVAPTITGPTDGAKGTDYNFNISGVDNAGYQVKYGLDWDNDGVQDGVTVLGASNWTYTWTNNWGGGGLKCFDARTITSDGRYSGWSQKCITIHDKPIVSISAAATPINYNAATTITWSSGDSTSCSVTKAGSAWQTGLTGSAISTGTLTADTTFVLTCNGAGGTNTASTVVYVKPSVTLTATPTSIAYNAATTISWSSIYASTCSVLKEGVAWLTGVSNAGVTSGPLVTNTLFQIDCTSAAGTLKSATAFVTVAPLNGVCNVAHYVCDAGTSANNINGAMKWTWDCNGANGGTNATCEETKPNPTAPVITGPTSGKINTNYTFGFTATNPSGDPIRYAIDWDNSGTVDGYLPVSGTTAQGTTLNWTNQWAGSGTKTFKVRTETNGGPVSTWTTYNIDLYGLPVITWTPASANVPYGGRLTLGYTATDASYCNLYATLTDDWNTYEGTPYISNGATSNSWTSAGPYYKNFKRKAVCYNPFGEYSSAEIAVNVLQNAGTCGTITAPEYLLPSQTFNPVITMNNTGTNVWTNGSPLKHRIYTSISNWSAQYLPITNGPIGTGQLGNFTGSISAPATEGLYDFTWRVIEDLEAGGTDVFGPICNPTTSNGNKIVVKNPTLGVGDTDVDVDLLAFPTNYVASDPAITKTLTIRNRGGGNVTGNVTIPAGLFSCVAGCNFNIGPGGTSVATISFQSSATGTFGEYATINSDAGTKTVNLTGKTGDKFTVVTSPVNFGQVATTRSKFLTLTITNNSVVQTSSAFAISPTAPFYCVSGCASAAVGPGETRTIRLKFNPTVENASPITQDLVLPTTPSITISLVGQGVKPTFKVEEK